MLTGLLNCIICFFLYYLIDGSVKHLKPQKYFFTGDDLNEYLRIHKSSLKKNQFILCGESFFFNILLMLGIYNNDT